MAETNLNIFTNGVASYLSSCIFPAIVQGFAVKGINTSVEELLGMTNTPSTRSPATPVVPTPSVPAMAFGGAVPVMAPAVAPTNNRKTTSTNAPVPGRTCLYQFKRGENKGKFCGRGTAPGNEFCATCLKTRKNLTKEISAGAIPGASPAMGAIPGMGGLPPGYSAPTPAVPAANAAPSQEGKLSVVPYDESRGLFREPNQNFIVYQVSPGVIAVVGKLNEADNKIDPLSAQEQGTAQAIGLVLGEGAAVNTTPAQTPAAIPAATTPAVTTVPAVPTANTAQAVPAIPTAVPTVNTAQAVPAIPTAVNQPAAHLVGTGHPALPVIAPLAVPTQSTVQATSVPNIPAIPQLNI